jgi:hypothetical protein
VAAAVLAVVTGVAVAAGAGAAQPARGGGGQAVADGLSSTGCEEQDCGLNHNEVLL